MNFNDVVKEYNKLLDKNSKSKSYEFEQKIVELLENFIKQYGLLDDQKIWAYWNISDNYALQRKHQQTYLNHLQFEKYVRSINELKYMLMLICDTTQRLSIIESGHSSYWNDLYYEINHDIDINDDNYCIYFEVLRTASYPLMMKSFPELTEHALIKMKKLIEMYTNDSQHLRFKNLYYCRLLSYNYLFSQSDNSLLNKSYSVFKQLKPYLKTEKIMDNELFGTYESWNTKRSLWYQARSIHDYIITLIDTENYDIAYKCYLEIGNEEYTSAFFKKKINLLKEKLKQ